MAASFAAVCGVAWAQEAIAPPQPPAPVFPQEVPTVDATARFQLQRFWPTRKFDCPVALARVPGQPAREVLLLQRGEVWLLPEDRMSGEPELILDLREKVKTATRAATASRFIRISRRTESCMSRIPRRTSGARC